jgi:hypothetical protein
MNEAKVRKVNCCATCEFGYMTEEKGFPYVVCPRYGNRHPGELCDDFRED